MTDAEKSIVTAIVYFKGKLDIYCLKCEKETPFSTEGLDTWSKEFCELKWEDLVKQRLFVKHFTCLRCGHQISFVSYLDTESKVISKDPLKFDVKHTFQKIGQFPSLADLAEANVLKYRKFLGKPSGVEYSKAIGLAALGWDEKTFLEMRMDEKIKAL